ncbi:LacI family DNA-binding transcriptional regulator [Streptomonospora wellingtoniae]|uniref:LacI family DNA-binding transcriptional regulator n=1 Tax=Streptomonospora wellingtoniae TaxID=3075544 RepID=A0ABU2KN68_9ACTN|nr:LacI family DNA-binding transcriptional regulator [Streptomonospora sp. DSM 45055]MDT0300709.1 LacI family DNA-binding transcriptional regulator [Streptomonospora sp. DSM 45055]
MTAGNTGRKRPTISDVARRAGVTKGAVSRALNSGTGVSTGTRERIRLAAVELGWSPSYAARALNGKPLGTIGLVVRRSPEILDFDAFFPSFLSGIESVLSGEEHATVIRFVPDAQTEAATYERLFGDRFVDGFLVTDLRVDDERPAMLHRLGAPAVVVGAPEGSSDLPTITNDAEEAIRGLVRRFADAGHRRIAHVQGDRHMLHALQRRRHWEQAMGEFGLEPGPVEHGGYTIVGGAQATERILARSGDERPTAVFYGSDLMAIGGYSVLGEAGLAIPADVAVAGFDDIPLASFASPPMTTVRSKHRALGSAGARILLDMLKGQAPPLSTVLTGELCIRDSSGDPV